MQVRLVLIRPTAVAVVTMAVSRAGPMVLTKKCLYVICTVGAVALDIRMLSVVHRIFTVEVA